jgi:preprotein translocase subunit SecG
VIFAPLCGSGGTGRHTILRGWRRKAWGFKSPLPHHTYFHGDRAPNGPSIGVRRVAEIMIILLTIIHIIVCFFLIIVVLLQSGKSGDIAAAFGGQGSQTAFGPRGAASALSRATTWSAIIFMVTSISLSILAQRRGGAGSSALSGLGASSTKSQPTPPATTPAPPAK